MSEAISRKLKVIFGLFLAGTFVVAFQNCSQPFDFSTMEFKSASNGNGTGYDGKPYANHGTCGTNPSLQLKSTIYLQQDGTGLLVREDCQDRDIPKVIEPSDMKGSQVDREVFVYSNEVFDSLAPAGGAPRKLTRMICWSQGGSVSPLVTTEMRVWYYGDALLLNGTDPRLLLQQSDSSGYVSNMVDPMKESYNSTTQVEYKGIDQATGMSYDFELYLATVSTVPDYGKSVCTDSAGISQTIGGYTCYSQALNPPPGIN